MNHLLENGLNILKSINPYAGSASLLVSVALLITTIVYAVITRGLLIENRRIREAGAAPHVVAYASSDERISSVINLVVENVGTGPAFNVHISYEGDLNALKSYGFLSFFPDMRMITTVLPQSRRLVFPLGIAWQIYSGREEVSIFNAVITYENTKGRKFNIKNSIDLNTFRGMKEFTSTPENIIAKSIEKIASDSSKLVNGINTIRVEIFDREKYEVELSERFEAMSQLRPASKKESIAESENINEKPSKL